MHEFYNIYSMGIFSVDPFQFFFNGFNYKGPSQTSSTSTAPHWNTYTPAAAAVPPDSDRYAPIDLTKYSCDSPFDPEDLYYYVSSQNGKGPYNPVTQKELWVIARKATGNESNQTDSVVYTKWSKSDIPNTNATGCTSQNLGNSGIFFGVQVDGKNKVIIDDYNATFPNPPTPFPAASIFSKL